MKKKWSTRMLVEAGIMIALSYILSRFKIYRLPNGGSVTAGSFVPIILFSLRWGVGPGLIVGFAYGVLRLLSGSTIYTPVQAFLDYVLSFGLLGIAGIFKNTIDTGVNVYPKIFLATLTSLTCTFICNVISGVVFFSMYTPEGMSDLVYSMTYNISFIIPELIITTIIILLLWKPIKRADI